MQRIQFALVAAGLLAAGCSGPSLVFNDTVAGTVTLDGTPVPNALVQFAPDVPEGSKAPTSTGVTDEKGNFKLTRGDNQKPGALVGSHRVAVMPGRDDGSQRAVQVPAAYLTAARTPLRVEVTKDKTAYEVRLTRAGGPER